MTSTTPPWVANLSAAIDDATVAKLTRMRAPTGSAPKPAAVLMIFAGNTTDFADAHVLLVQRREGLRKHSGHVAFPGGSVEPADSDRVATALRETREETSLDTDAVTILGELPELYLGASNYAVTPVVAWADHPLAIQAGSPEEIASVHWVHLADLLNPAHRVRTHLAPGLATPAFDLPHLFVWGFTGGLLARFLDLAQLSPPWDTVPAVHHPKTGLTPPRPAP